ncbi:MAG TPA: maleylpyruvate isomerase N-terminal domain-containing protein [Micrococcaceae bacterium]
MSASSASVRRDGMPFRWAISRGMSRNWAAWRLVIISINDRRWVGHTGTVEGKTMAWMEAERQALVTTFRETDPGAPTLCAGWNARRLLAHLVQREHSPWQRAADALRRPEPGHERNLTLRAARGGTDRSQGVGPGRPDGTSGRAGASRDGPPRCGRGANFGQSRVRRAFSAMGEVL